MILLHLVLSLQQPDLKKELTLEMPAQRLEVALAMPVKVGDKVMIVGGGRQQGEVLEIRRDKFLVRLGGVLSTWVDRKQFVHWGLEL